jgi:energy-coupling factor transport system substrate-specific component
MSKGMKTKDIMVTAMISAVVGLFLMVWSNLYMPLQPILGPVGIEVLYGMYFVPGIICMYVIRKPGFAFLGGVIAGIIEILAGSPFGMNIFVAGVVQGGASELVFALTKYKKFDWVTVALSGVLAAVAIYVRDFFVFGYGALAPGVLVAMIIVRMISGAILGGGVSIIVAEALAKTGVLRNFAIGKKNLSA